MVKAITTAQKMKVKLGKTREERGEKNKKGEKENCTKKGKACASSLKKVV